MLSTRDTVINKIKFPAENVHAIISNAYISFPIKGIGVMVSNLPILQIVSPERFLN